MTYKTWVESWAAKKKDRDKKRPKVFERTLADAQEYVEANKEKGFICPCCHRPGKVRPRVFNVGIARCLLWLVRQYETTGGWVNFQRQAPLSVMKSREWSKLRFWGLAVPKTEGRRMVSGDWKPTEKGIEFAYGRCSIPSHVFTYSQSQVLGFSKTHIRIDEAVPFDAVRFLRGEG